LFSDKEQLEWQVKNQAKVSNIMVIKKQSETDQLVNSIQAKINKLKRERKAGKRKEPQIIDIICTGEDIARSKKR
jgi:7,8-dihydro-6-hydroxymethylpterin-pyrophosphokinase